MRSLQGIRFARDVGDSKNSRLSEKGCIQSRFRLNITRAVIKELQSDDCAIFDSRSNDYENIERPEWLRDGFIDDVGITFVHESKESKGGKKGQRLTTRKLDRSYYSSYIIDSLYKN